MAASSCGGGNSDSATPIWPANAFVLVMLLRLSRSRADDIIMLADGNGDFTTALGLEMDGSKFGMGKRSQRYSMIVKDGVVKELNVEQGGEFRVSAADYLLAQL